MTSRLIISLAAAGLFPFACDTMELPSELCAQPDSERWDPSKDIEDESLYPCPEYRVIPPDYTATTADPYREENPNIVAGTTPGQFIFVVGGTFEMGTPAFQPDNLDRVDFSCQPDEHEAGRCSNGPVSVRVDNFEIMNTEVTVGMYEEFLDAISLTDDGNYDPIMAGELVQIGRNGSTGNYSYFDSPLRQDFPMVYVTYNNAQAYCVEMHGGRLPTEAEWEYAARSLFTDANNQVFPWGGSYQANGTLNSELVDPAQNLQLANWFVSLPDALELGNGDGYMRLAPVGSFPLGTTAGGLLDMAGNAYEWVFDIYSDDFYGQSNVNPVGPAEGLRRSIRGGSWRSNTVNQLRVRNRDGANPDLRSDHIGFRCARDA